MTDMALTLSSDRPSTNPHEDLFGHAPFAKALANAIRDYRGMDGIVLALYGPWGSGKSTVLAYIEHELEQTPEDSRPVVVPFNPWWFSGQEHLAKAFLGQLQAVLPAKFEGFKALGDKLSEFSGALGGVVDVAGAAFGMPLGGKVIEAGAKLLGTKPKDVPALKKALSQILAEQKKRVLVVIDDIDRLAPDEVRQLFTVIKALADFPYVTYLLAFDREVAATAISEQTGLPGDRYLEKIIQVPFELPRVDRTTLLQALFVRLDSVMVGTPEGRFDKRYWNNVFHSGLDALFMVPRDIVRLTNALNVTYPAVVGEVNPVDFIAIECLRVFLPAVYDAIRSSPDEFTGYQAPRDATDRQRVQAFHNAWLNKLPESSRLTVQELVQRLFPRLEAVWSNMHYSADSLYEWRRTLRICSPDIFPTYFRLSLPEGAVSRAEIDVLLSTIHDSHALAEVFRAARVIKTFTGTSKARSLLERLMDHVPTDLDGTCAEPVISALFAVGDELLIATDKVRGLFDFGNESRVSRIIYHLLKKVESEARLALLVEAMRQASALRCSQYLLAALSDEAEKAAKGEGEALLPIADVNQLKFVWKERLDELSASDDFIDHTALAYLLRGWRHWGGEKEVKGWWEKASATDAGLLKLISAFVTEVTAQTSGEYAVRTSIRVNPKSIQPYGDIEVMLARVKGMLDANAVDEKFKPAAMRFIVECQRLQEGKDPDAFDFDDEED